MWSNISSDFEGIGLSVMEDSYSIIQRRPYGGVGILIRKTSLYFMTVQDLLDVK